jgi:succinylglutamate desuccinylase
MADVLRNRPVAFSLPVPLILGIEEILEGSLMGYLCDLGHVAVAVEGGQSQAPRTQRHHEAAIWLTLVAAGALEPAQVPELAEAHRLLADAARGLPPVIEIRHRHLVDEADGFAMEQGWASFQPVRAGQPVASDRKGEVRAPEGGLMLMPRYQGQGEDGFFVARPVSPFWLRVSAWLRALRVDRLAPLLPGIRRDAADPDRLLANPRVARFQRVNVFHLLGYRHVRSQPGALAFARRRPGFRGLRQLPAELLPALEAPVS